MSEERERSRTPNRTFRIDRRGISIRLSQRGNAMLAGVLAILGLVLIVVGLSFYAIHPTSWPTPTAYILFGLAVFSVIGVLYHHKYFWGSLALIFTFSAAVIAIGHYLHYF